MALPHLPAGFLTQLGPLAQGDRWRTDAATRETYGKDWTRVVAPNASAVFFPTNTADVATFLKAAHHHGVGVVPSGGRTGYAGGAVAPAGEVVLSMERLNAMDPVDALGETVRVQAGAVTEAVHQHCTPSGLTWPIDFASKGSSHVGGNIATNAGGVKVIRYGLTRQWVLGLQVVLATGQILELNGALEKNNTGLDLRQLFIGSEGTLGVVTEATLKLVRLPGDLQVLLFALSGMAQVLSLFRQARHGPFRIMAYEFFTAQCLNRLRRHRSVATPFAEEAPYCVLLEVEQFERSTLETWMADVFQQSIVENAVVASTAAQGKQLWQLREGISESLAATGLPHKNDISLPLAQLEAFCAELESFFPTRYPHWEICLFGHVGDGNLHVNVMKPDDMSKEVFYERTRAADDDIFALVQKYRGSISAEHGIGLLKKRALPYSRAPHEIHTMRGIKTVLDPRGILNPGKIM